MSSFYCACLTEYVTLRKEGGGDEIDELDEVMSELSEGRSLRSTH